MMRSGGKWKERASGIIMDILAVLHYVCRMYIVTCTHIYIYIYVYVIAYIHDGVLLVIVGPATWRSDKVLLLKKILQMKSAADGLVFCLHLARSVRVDLIRKLGGGSSWKIACLYGL